MYFWLILMKHEESSTAQRTAQGCNSETAIEEPVITHTHFSPPSIWGAVIKLSPTSHWWQRIYIYIKKRTWGKSAYPAPSAYIHKPVLHQTRDGTSFACLTFILHSQPVNSTHVLKCSVNSRTRWSEGGFLQPWLWDSGFYIRGLYRDVERERGVRDSQNSANTGCLEFCTAPLKAAVPTGRCVGILY